MALFSEEDLDMNAALVKLLHVFMYVIGVPLCIIFSVYVIARLFCLILDFSRPVEKVLQSEELPEENGARISCFKDGESLLTAQLEDIPTLFHSLLRGKEISENGQCLGYRPSHTSRDYEWINYEEVIVRSIRFGSGLTKIDCEVGPFIGIYSKNKVEYVIAEYGAYSRSKAIVPLYDTLGKAARRMVLQETELSTVICDADSRIRSLLEDGQLTPDLKTIIYIRDLLPKTAEMARLVGIKLLSFKDVESLGCMSTLDPVVPSQETLAVVCYTSGTSGNPKGVMLTHSNIMANVHAVKQQLGSYSVTKNDVMMSFLPLAHMFERCCHVSLFMAGGSIGFFSGDIYADLKLLKPTMLPLVPRLANRWCKMIQDTVGKGFTKKVFDFMIASIQLLLRKKKHGLVKLVSRLLFRKIQNSLGGRVRFIVIGSAPTSSKILTLLRCVLGCMIVEGYGQTECVSPCTLTFPEESDAGHVGPPLPCGKIKLIDVPDLEYYSVDQQGEICVKGKCVFQGYFKDEEATRNVLDDQGWLHTGDIGKWCKNGVLQVIDRKGDIIKLSQGEFVSFEKIESVYSQCSVIKQIFVYGTSYKSYLVGIAHLNQNAVNSEFAYGEPKRQVILDVLTVEGNRQGLQSFEQIKGLYITQNEFTIDNKLLTPTLKIRRRECAKVFEKEIEYMYYLLG